MIHLGDITKIDGFDIPLVDVVTGGSPCQDLSVAGKRAGLDGEQPGLFMEQIRVIKEMRDHDRAKGTPVEYIRPRYMVWENVPGAFSSNSGKDFQAVLTEVVRIVKPDAPDVPLPERGGDGTNQGASWVPVDSGVPFPSPGEYTMRSFGESPREENVSRLSQILEDSAQQKYYLSARACLGILNRAAKRGKELPEILKAALTNQIQHSCNASD